ncbi:MAG: 2-oxoglutarate synthase [gamma proteobacterium endosymbiont of Lamellibrachia anaximandri]|nr:2-oxoglutarate synthase [gamma proteobacterium endosymbiont of Lamellibrachia anaximandri]MBL3532352.1 2-oxoglutarate synthase [gamma proteobacterium endosymbiont of Lamellibrachia anaximandri]MBL3598530.1 2-oxoglutarate synthase [gamma proteobacterium endosymbiont of Lamellibrachia anaximandri]
MADDGFFGTGFNKSFNIRLSGFMATTSTEIRVDSAGGVIGETLSFEDDLNLSDREILPLLDITYRFNPRHMLDFSYVDLGRNGATTFTKGGTTTDDIQWSVGTEMQSRFESEVYRLAYGYSFINDGKKEFGVLLGLHVTRFNVGLSGRGSLVAVDPDTGNEIVVEGEGERSYDSGFTVPLPVVGLHGTYAFTPNFRVRGWGQFFSLKYDNYDGSMINASGMLEYDLFENLGIGVGYAYYGYDLDADRDDLKGGFSYDFSGPTAFFYASF